MKTNVEQIRARILKDIVDKDVDAECSYRDGQQEIIGFEVYK